MHTSLNSVYRAIRQIVFDNRGVDDSFCFDLGESTDASSNQRGDLFEQNGDFYLVEVEIDQVTKAGPGTSSPRRVYGGVDIRFFTKDRLDDLGAKAKLEAIGDWFGSQTTHGIRFREFYPAGDGRLIGFQEYSATVPFECEIEPKQGA